MSSSDVESHEPKPHPDAPKDIAENFDHYKKLHDTGPHFNPDKLEQQNASQGESQASEEASNLFDLPPRFWNTPSLRWSPAEMEADCRLAPTTARSFRGCVATPG